MSTKKIAAGVVGLAFALLMLSGVPAQAMSFTSAGFVQGPATVDSAATSTTGTFCVSGNISSIAYESGTVATSCGLRGSTYVTTIMVDIDGSTRLWIFKYFSPDSVLCSGLTYRSGDHVSICGSVVGSILNAGTVNETSVVNLYPQSIAH